MAPLRARCPVCDGSLRAAEPAAPPDDILRCLACGHGLRTRVQPQPPAWRDGAPAGLPPGSPARSWDDFDRAWLRVQLLRDVLSNGGTLLDLASSPGVMPSLLSATPIAARASALCDVAPDETFDAICLWSGLDDSESPVEDLARIRRHLAPGAVVFVAVSGPGAAPSRIQEFTPQSVVLALQRAGFDAPSHTQSALGNSKVPEQLVPIIDHLATAASVSPLLEHPFRWLRRLAGSHEREGEIVMTARRPR